MINKNLIWHIALALCLPIFVHAQDSTKTSIFQSHFFKHLKYKWTNDLLFQTGNINRFLYNTQMLYSYADSLFDFEIKPRFIYGEVKQKNASGEIVRLVQEREPFIEVHVGIFSLRRFYGFAFGTAEESNLRKINFRWTGGGGVGWHVIRTKDQYHKLTVTAAVLREETDFIPITQKDVKIFRGSFRLKGNNLFFEKKLKISYIYYFMPSLQWDNNKRHTANVSLEIPFSKRLNVRAAYDLTYDAIVPEGIKNLDTRLMIGVALSNL